MSLRSRYISNKNSCRLCFKKKNLVTHIIKQPISKRYLLASVCESYIQKKKGKVNCVTRITTRHGILTIRLFFPMKQDMKVRSEDIILTVGWIWLQKMFCSYRFKIYFFKWSPQISCCLNKIDPQSIKRNSSVATPESALVNDLFVSSYLYL